MFSEKSKIRIENRFGQLAQEVPFLQKAAADRLETCKEETALAMKYLYTTMPLSDIGNYPFETFSDYAGHGIKLWEKGIYSRQIPEDIFLNYVLYHRINEEEILPCRTFFYDQIKNRVEGLTMKEAVLEVNYWCAEEATYRSTDARTVAPMTVYRCGYGRCGEESIFTVSALRSIGIPARQVYTPRWSHCDDNHAWVEVWCDGSWYFLGACEPEAILNKGWFTNASSRAMLIHSRWFDFIDQEEEVISKEGMVTLVNQLERYAPVHTVMIKVVDEKGEPIREAKVEFLILNYSEFVSLDNILTDENGIVSIKLGLGNILIRVSKSDMHTEILIDARRNTDETIVLKAEIIKENFWKAFDMIVPADSPMNTDIPTPLQKSEGDVKYARAVAKRLEKVKNLRNREIDLFLNSDFNTRNLKEKMLGILTAKDQNDCKAEILEEHVQYAIPYLSEYDEIIYLNYLLNPRIQDEPLSKYRSRINNYFSKAEKESFQNQPGLIWNWIEDNIHSLEEKEHPKVITTPAGCIELGIGSKLSKHILYVAVARTFGIPARLNSRDGSLEYWNKKEWVPVLQSTEKSSNLLLLSGEGKNTWTYYQNYTISHYDRGNYTTLKLDQEEFVNGQLNLSLEPGRYRIITSNRLPNGNIFANQYTLSLKDGETEKVVMSLREAKLSDMLENISMNDFSLRDETGKTILGSEITKGRKRILLWLEERKEPTEHILNELLDRKEEFKEFSKQLVIIVHNKKSLEDSTISKVLTMFPKADILYDDFNQNVQTLGRRLYVDPDKLPLIIVTSKELNAIYANSGYNVGTGNMLLRLMKEDL
ncbi:MAG: transglutaminase-like domain-containing protein [Anaerocolumna sp.]